MNPLNQPSSGLPLSRRQFLTRSLAASSAFAVPNIIPASALGRGGAVAPSERIVMGAIGLGGRGSGDLGWLLGEANVQFVAVCDVRKGNREGAKNAVDGRYANKDCAAYRDMRDLFAKHPEIDAMLIATGDRWHTPASILAMQNGKDVYCEKPGALTIAQGILAICRIGHGSMRCCRHNPNLLRTSWIGTCGSGPAHGVPTMAPLSPSTRRPVGTHNMISPAVSRSGGLTRSCNAS